VIVFLSSFIGIKLKGRPDTSTSDKGATVLLIFTRNFGLIERKQCGLPERLFQKFCCDPILTRGWPDTVKFFECEETKKEVIFDLFLYSAPQERAAAMESVSKSIPTGNNRTDLGF
jgi:hypothetical protein